MLKNSPASYILAALLSLPLAMTGCSFRKEPVKPTQEKAEAIKVESFADKFSSKTSQDLITDLNTLSDGDLYSQNVLDLAVQNKKLDVITYLLAERNISPFSYDKDSENLIEASPTLMSLFEPYQQANLVNILIQIRKNNTLQKWDEVLLKNQIRSGSCKHLFQSITDWYYYRNILNTPDGVVQLQEADVADTFITLSQTGTCNNLKNEFSLLYLNNWLQNELKIQYYRKFQSSKIVELLKTLANFQDVSVDIADKDGIVRIDPRMLVLASLPVGQEIDKKKYWLDLLKPITSTKAFFYNVPYQTGENQCDKSDILCEETNTQGVGVVMYWMGHPDMDTPRILDESTKTENKK